MFYEKDHYLNPDLTFETGMKDRHWESLAEKTGCDIPTDRSLMTLQGLCDMGLNNHMADVEKIAEKAGKEFGEL